MLVSGKGGDDDNDSVMVMRVEMMMMRVGKVRRMMMVKSMSAYPFETVAPQVKSYDASGTASMVAARVFGCWCYR